MQLDRDRCYAKNMSKTPITVDKLFPKNVGQFTRGQEHDNSDGGQWGCTYSTVNSPIAVTVSTVRLTCSDTEYNTTFAVFLVQENNEFLVQTYIKGLPTRKKITAAMHHAMALSDRLLIERSYDLQRKIDLIRSIRCVNLA